MYDNIGGKIKALVKTLVTLQVVALVIGGLICCVYIPRIGVLIGMGIVIVGALLAWISSWFIYAFGELVEQTCVIARNTGNGKGQVGALTRSEKLADLYSKDLISEEEYRQEISKEE